MYSTMIRNSERMCSRHMVFITTSFILFIICFTLIDALEAQEAQDAQIRKNDMKGAIDAKRSSFLPSRGRRFWSMFDWNDSSGEKRMSRFLPMRGRKAGFLPMRGKKAIWDELNSKFVDLDGLNDGTGSSDGIHNRIEFIDKRAAFMPSRGKKAFHAMRGKKSLYATDFGYYNYNLN